MSNPIAKSKFILNPAANAHGRDEFDLGIGDPKDKPPQLYYDSLKKFVNDHRSSHYPDSIGEPELLTAASNHYLEFYNLKFDPASEICVTDGARRAIYTVLCASGRKGALCAYVSPAYFGIPNAIKAAGLVPFPISIDLIRGSIKILRNLFKKIRDGIFILVNPQNPLGVILSPEELKKLSRVAREYNIKVISDFVYKDIFTTEAPRSFLEFDNEAVEICSFSKTFRVCGLRCGYIIGKGKLIKQVRQWMQLTENGVPPLTQFVMAELLTNMSEVEDFRISIAERRSILIDVLEQTGFKVNHLENTGTNFVWAQIPKSFKSSIVAAVRLENAGIKVVSGDQLGINGERHLRFSLNYPPAVMRIAAQKIERAFL